MRAIIGLVAFLVAGQNASAELILVQNPLKHATEFATEFSVGDDNQHGSVVCDYFYREDQGFTRIVNCEGTRNSLMHGGHMVNTRFNCSFEYLMSIYGGFEVVSATCN